MEKIKSNEVRHYSSIDFSKFIMAIFVIAIHTRPLIECVDQRILNVYELLVRMAVPTFFMSSGYLLAKKIGDFDNVENKVSVLYRQLKKTMKMYFVWNVIYFPMALYGYYLENRTLLWATIDYIKGFVFVGEHYNSWHLWYLLSCIYAIAFVIGLIKLNVNKKGFLILICGIWFISNGMDALMGYEGSLPFIARGIRFLISHTTVNGRILQGVYYIPLGMLMVHKRFEENMSMAFFAFCVVCNYTITNTFVSSILLTLASVALFDMILRINIKSCLINRVSYYLRSISVDMYFVHLYVWTCYYILRYGEKTFGIDSFLITTIVSIGIGIIRIFYKNRKKQRIIIENFCDDK